MTQTFRSASHNKQMRGVKVNAELRDVIVNDLEALAEKHRVALSTIAKMAYAEVRSRAA